jgi:predicted nuclease with RNAse H fold
MLRKQALLLQIAHGKSSAKYHLRWCYIRLHSIKAPVLPWGRPAPRKLRDKSMGVIDSLARTAFKIFGVNPENILRPAITIIWISI